MNWERQNELATL